MRFSHHHVRSFCLLAGVAVLTLAPRARADVPRLIHYQGKLLTAAGVPATGAVTLRVRLYDHATASTTPLLDETYAGITLTRGLFALHIGASSGGVPDSALVPSAVYLGVTVGGGDELTPRTRIVTTPYGVKARAAETLVVPGSMTAAVTVDGAGNVGVGTASPAQRLDVNGTVKASAITGLTTPLSVDQGGSGASSLTAYAPLFGGTTATGAIQSGAVGTSGQVLTSNGPGALPTFQAAGGGAVPVVQVYTSSTTWTKPAGLKYVIVEVVGGGGSGGNTSGAGSAGGGGGGGYSRKLISAAGLGATESVTVGGATQTSSFGSHLQATGGGNASGTAGGSGGMGSGGDVNAAGNDGDSKAGGSSVNNSGGSGGGSVYGGGGRGGSGNNSNGVGGRAFGGGGGGASDDGSGSQSGGGGASGVVIVTEYY